MQHVEAPLPPVAGEEVAEHVLLRVPHVQVARGVREHVEDVLAGPLVPGVGGAEELQLVPARQPLLLQLLGGGQAIGVGVGHHRVLGSSVGGGTAFNPRGICAYADPAGGPRRSPPPADAKEHLVDTWLTAALASLEAIGAWRYLVAFVGMFCETSLLVGLIVPGDTIVLVTATADQGRRRLAAPAAHRDRRLARRRERRIRARRLVRGPACGPAGSVGGSARSTGCGRSAGWTGAAASRSSSAASCRCCTRSCPSRSAPATCPYRRFLAWTAPACTLWALIYVSVGTLAGTSYRALSGTLALRELDPARRPARVPARRRLRQAAAAPLRAPRDAGGGGDGRDDERGGRRSAPASSLGSVPSAQPRPLLLSHSVAACCGSSFAAPDTFVFSARRSCVVSAADTLFSVSVIVDESFEAV